MKYAISFLIIFLAFYSIYATEVSGIQSGMWTPDNNPYQIIGDVTIPVNEILFMEPGVVVEAMGNFQIIAQGCIIAVGGEQDSIKFLSGLADQTTLWKGIRLENTAFESQFNYCLIELGQYGINSINSPASITHCRFNKNQKGIQAYGIGSANPANVIIDHNLIESSQQSGIYVVQNSNAAITYNDITLNGTGTAYYGAIQLSNQSDGGSCNPEIANNHIHHNYKQGIIASDIFGDDGIYPEVHHNLIENNLTGIYFLKASGYLHHNTVINNFIPGNMNSGAGIMVSGNTAHPYFLENTITGNYTGFYLTENANPVIGDLSNNNIYAQGGNTIMNNIDANSVLHSIACFQYTATTFTVKAENNTWDYTNATQIAETITDFNDNPTFPTIDYTPWFNSVEPIYLAGTVVSNNPELTSVSLQLVSANTGNILNQWTVQCNTPFQEPVYHDSLVYIVARGSDLSQVEYYGAYGSLQDPTAIQIVADVQFDIGNLFVINQYPDWSFQKVGNPQTLDGHLCYPISFGWFVYTPTLYWWVFRDGDYLRIYKLSILHGDGGIVDYSTPGLPIWRKIANLSTNDSWQQYLDYDFMLPNNIMGAAISTSDITYPASEDSLGYNRIDVIGADSDLLQIYDDHNSRWIYYDINHTNCTVDEVHTEAPVLVEPDGTLFSLQTGNVWKVSNWQQDTNPTYFGYTMSDSLSFYWIPPRTGLNYVSYRLYNNGNLVVELPISAHTYSIPIPYDGMEHTYTLSAWDGTNNHSSAFPIVLLFTHDIDEVIIPQVLSAYPNPFNPAHTSLTLKFDNSKAISQELKVYNLKGQLVWKADINKGATELKWNGKDNKDKICASGLYQMQLTDNKGHKLNRKLMLIH